MMDEISVPAKKERNFNLNRGLHRGQNYYSTHHHLANTSMTTVNNSQVETRKFMQDMDETVPSEEFRDVVPLPAKNSGGKLKMNQSPTFETPRFILANSHREEKKEEEKMLNQGSSEDVGDSEPDKEDKTTGNKNILTVTGLEDENGVLETNEDQAKL